MCQVTRKMMGLLREQEPHALLVVPREHDLLLSFHSDAKNGSRPMDIGDMVRILRAADPRRTLPVRCAEDSAPRLHDIARLTPAPGYVDAASLIASHRAGAAVQRPSPSSGAGLSAAVQTVAVPGADGGVVHLCAAAGQLQWWAEGAVVLPYVTELRYDAAHCELLAKQDRGTLCACVTVAEATPELLQQLSSAATLGGARSRGLPAPGTPRTNAQHAPEGCGPPTPIASAVSPGTLPSPQPKSGSYRHDPYRAGSPSNQSDMLGSTPSSFGASLGGAESPGTTMSFAARCDAAMAAWSVPPSPHCGAGPGCHTAPPQLVPCGYESDGTRSSLSLTMRVHHQASVVLPPAACQLVGTPSELPPPSLVSESDRCSAAPSQASEAPQLAAALLPEPTTLLSPVGGGAPPSGPVAAEGALESGLAQHAALCGPPAGERQLPARAGAPRPGAGAAPPAAVPRGAPPPRRAQQQPQRTWRVCVLFKHGRRMEFTAPERFAPGDYVLVDTPFGADLGLVSGTRGHGRKGDRYRVRRRATPAEVAQWQDLAADGSALECARQCAQRLQLQLTLHRADWQFDRSRVTVHFSSPAPVGADAGAPLAAAVAAALGAKAVLNNCQPGPGQVGDALDLSAPELPSL